MKAPFGMVENTVPHTSSDCRAGTKSADDLPMGIAADRLLPYAPFAQLWDSVIVESRLKDRLLAQAVLSFTLRPKLDASRVPLHGLILLVGPPGTGKTSLAKGLASRTAESLGRSTRLRYLEVEPHGLANAGLGRSQQGVRRLLNEVIAERAEMGPLIVLIDEVETLAVDRGRLSLEANPVDVHRATDAVLAGIDQLAATYPQLLFVATSNFEMAVDSALLSRADLVETIPLPGQDVAGAIVRDTIAAIGEAYPQIARVLDDPALVTAIAACQGLDGRQIRKVVVAACALDKRTALDPGLLTAADIVRAAESARRGYSYASRGGER